MMTSGGTAAGTEGRGQTPSPVAVKPFTRASMEHRESAGIDKTVTMSASDQDLGAFMVPAYGYVRGLVLLVEVTGGAGTAVFAGDSPWNVLKNIIVQEPNGSTICQFNSGYDLYLANKFSGYRGYNDPKKMPVYSTNVTGGTAKFALRIPFEISGRSSLGALPNQNSAAAFQLRMTLAAASNVYTTSPTTLPNVRIRVLTEAWDQPAVSSDGVANQVTPPAMNTTQFWSKQSFPINPGVQSVRLNRVGNYLRNLIFVYRDTTGARVPFSSNNFPTLPSITFDTRPIDTVISDIWLNTMYERTGYGNQYDQAGGLDNGVWVYDFAHEFNGAIGQEMNDGWLPTLASTRLELGGNFGVAGTLEVLTNDVSVSGNVFTN